MKKKEIIIIISLLIFWGCAAYLTRDNKGSGEDAVLQPVIGGELLVSSKGGYHSVEIYKLENMLVINAESETEFFDDTQLTVETQGDISPEDIEIIWMTIGGGTEETEHNDFIIAEIKIYEDDELIFGTKINFIQKAIEAIGEVFENE